MKIVKCVTNKNKNVILVYPRTSEVTGGMLCPLGIQYLASYLINNGVACDIIDLTFTSWGKYKRKLLLFKPDFIGFSIQTPIAEQGLKAIKIAHEISPKSKIIVGGAHAAVDTKSLLKIPYVNHVVVGEGEKAIIRIIKGEERRRLIYGEPIENLNDIPFPIRQLMNYDEYLKINHEIELMVSRGCPYNCMFCQPTQRRMFGNKVRIESPENAIEEVKNTIRRYGKSFTFYFVDDTFTWNRKWVYKFCRLAKPLKIKWKCLTRVNLVDEKLLNIMKDSGCVQINYGVESGSQKILDFMRKGITVEQIKKAFYFTHKTGLLCEAYIIIGTPTETKEDLEMTRKLIEEIHPNGLQISIMTPLIGTDLEQYCKENNILNITKLSDYHYCMNEYPIKLEHLTKEDLQFYRDKIHKTWKSVMYKNYIKHFEYYLKFFVKSAIEVRK